jgi:4'-phosphopantetheinyl transferase
VALDDERFATGSWLGRLSPGEQARARRFKFAEDSRRYIVAHVALRDILARYEKVAAAELEFVEGANGKPRLTAELASSGLEFNLSHSRERALVAATRGRPLGVDVEFVRGDFIFQDVADRFFTRREVAALRALPLALQLQAFYKCWTSKEAFLKAKGTGLSGDLDEVEIGSIFADRIAIHASVAGWSLIELDEGKDYEGALVVEGNQALPIERHEWHPAESFA